MSNLLLYINLDSRLDRRQFLERQIADRKLSATRLTATTAAEAARLRIDMPHVNVGYTDVEVACNISHRRAWQWLVQSSFQAAVILEDDAVLGPGFENLLDWRLYEAANPSVIRLETSGKPVRLGTHKIKLFSNYVAYPMVSGSSGSGAYIISKSAAEYALKDPLSQSLLVDAYLFGTVGPFLHRRKVLHVSPAPVIQAIRVRELDDASLQASDLEIKRQARWAQSTSRRVQWKKYIRRRWALLVWTLLDPLMWMKRPESIKHSADI